MTRKILPALLVLFLITAACGFRFDLPESVTVGEDVTDAINVPVPASEPVRLELDFGAGSLTLAPGAAPALVEGTATYNITDLKPEITTTAGTVQIEQGNYSFQSGPLGDIKNIWDLKLGDAPMELVVNAGAYEGRFEFGGLALTGLTVRDGAADVDLSFSSPNAAEMSILRYETGASNVRLTGLGNANFTTLSFNSGAGDYTLDFSGEFQRDATATIESGLSNLILVIPEGVNARVTVESGVANINAGSGWSQSGNVYTQSGEGPTLTILVKTGAGNLTLTR
ncbi:MAG: toast rack family protein [Chloroflexota bacterium]